MKRTFVLSTLRRHWTEEHADWDEAERSAAEQGALIVDAWPTSDPPPRVSDARAWDAWRRRRGYAGG